MIGTSYHDKSYLELNYNLERLSIITPSRYLNPVYFHINSCPTLTQSYIVHILNAYPNHQPEAQLARSPAKNALHTANLRFGLKRVRWT